MAKVRYGIALYSMDKDGSLNGSYTNEHAQGIVYDEIAQRVTPLGNDPLLGTYECVYFEAGAKKIEANLNIDHNGQTYTFEWRAKNGNDHYRGVGHRMRNEIIAVRYESF